MKQIFILGAYGQNNLGDDALLQVFIQQFSRPANPFGDTQLLVKSARPAETAQQFGVKTVVTYLGWPRFSRLRAIVGSDLIVFGGGSLLKETEGHFLGQFLYFMPLLVLLVCA